MSSKNLFFVAAKLVASGLLVVAAFLRYPYDYYTLMRWVVCIVSAFGMLHAISIARHRWAWTLGITGVFFNPVFPVHLKREVWSCVDVVAAGVITVSIHLNFQKK